MPECICVSEIISDAPRPCGGWQTIAEPEFFVRERYYSIPAATTRCQSPKPVESPVGKRPTDAVANADISVPPGSGFPPGWDPDKLVNIVTQARSSVG